MQSNSRFDSHERRPQVCIWYSIYCACFLLAYMLTAIAGIAMAVFAETIAANSAALDKEGERISNMILGGGLAVVSVPLCILFSLGLLVPRRKWGWIYGFFPIAIGLSSPCCMPASIPLLLFWIKPNTRRWYNVD